MSYRLNLTLPALVCASICSLSAMDRPLSDPAYPRLVVQALVGTSGFEPGIVAEWRLHDHEIMLRPEVFISEDGRPGAGGSINWNLSLLNLPDSQYLTVGPRVVYHNSDDSGWEADALVIWNLDLNTSQRGRHFLEVIGALGVLQDKENDDGANKAVVGASIGAGYGYQF